MSTTNTQSPEIRYLQGKDKVLQNNNQEFLLVFNCIQV
jgi:hypothetical protein